MTFTQLPFCPYGVARLLRLAQPGLRGKARLARLLLGAHLDATDACMTDGAGNTFYVPQLREPIAFHLLIDGAYETELGRLIAQALAPGGTFVDVGASIGAGRLLAASAPPLIAFEFCDWAERRAAVGALGDAQRLLRAAGYQIWRLSDYLQGNRPLRTIMTQGSEMLVAARATGAT